MSNSPGDGGCSKAVLQAKVLCSVKCCLDSRQAVACEVTQGTVPKNLPETPGRNYKKELKWYFVVWTWPTWTPGPYNYERYR